MKEKDFDKIEVKNNICINVFRYENRQVFPVFVSDQEFENSIDSFLLIDDDKSHYVYIKCFNKFMFHKTKNKNIKHFCKVAYSENDSENVLTDYKKDCLSINGVQSVKSQKGTTEFKNYFKQIPAPFKIYADFEVLTQKRIKNTFLAVLLTKLLLLITDLVSQLLFLEVKMLLMNLLKQFLKNISTARK